jgi:hypothetical protein
MMKFFIWSHVLRNVYQVFFYTKNCEFNFGALDGISRVF